MKELIIIGASGHGKVVADIAHLNGYSISFLDDDTSKKTCAGYSVIGTSKDISEFKNSDFFVAIGNADIRERVQNQLLQSGFNVVSLIHPNAVIAGDSSIGIGTVVMAGAVVNSNSIVGEGCIINTGASVDHDNIIGNFSHISVGAHLAGTVNIGNKCWIGIGASVSNNISICNGCLIGAGAVVVKDIYENGTYVGIPARKV